MAYTYKKDHIPFNRNQRPGGTITPTTITIHNTGNESSRATGERAWMTNPENRRAASWHIVIDDTQAIEAIPLNEPAYHSGTTAGNYSSISIEICESGNYQQTLRNAADLAARLLKERGWGINKLRRHYDWSGKICPHLMYNGGSWTGWAAFKQMVQACLNGATSEDVQVIGGGSTGGNSGGGSVGGAKPLEKPSNDRIGKVTITATSLNVRTEPNANGGLVRAIPQGDVWNVYAYSGGWYRVHDGWVSGDYVKFEAVSGGSTGGGGATAQHGVVQITADVLNVRKGPGTGYPVAKQVAKNETYEFFAIQDGWYNVGGDQWVSGEFAKVISGNAPSTPTGRIGVATITATSLNVRSEPNANSRIVRSIPNGDSWNVYQESNGWLKVHDGWISAQYVSLRRV